MLHEPYTAPEHPVPINATIVHADTLLLPQIPQPDGARLHHALIDAPGRRDGELVPLSTITGEVGGLLSTNVDDWKGVVEALVSFSRDRLCDALHLSLDETQAARLGMAPRRNLTVLTKQAVNGPGGRRIGTLS